HLVPCADDANHLLSPRETEPKSALISKQRRLANQYFRIVTLLGLVVQGLLQVTGVTDRRPICLRRTAPSQQVRV
ncbi:MAG: hypothetical protein AAFQ21_16085, partial [Pseudomonadota bacterium]